MNEFKTIKEMNISEEVVEKKSRFIANLFYVQSVESAESIIKETKRKYYDAKHNCFAYLINEQNTVIKRFSDDGEPSGTAGAPMLEILEKENLQNIVIIVTRYFGGILLGTGGLVRAYSEALKKALSKATIIYEELGYEAEIEILYSDLEKFKYYCSKNLIQIIDYKYSENVTCKIDINEDNKNSILNEKNSQENIKILKFDIIRQKNIIKLSNNVD